MSQQRGRGGGRGGQDRGGGGFRGGGFRGGDRGGGGFRGGGERGGGFRGGGGSRGGDRGGFGDRGRGGGRGGFGREPGGVFLPNTPATIDARLSNNTQDKVLAGLKTITVNPRDLPVRPSFGTAGQAIKLRANFFPVTVPKGLLYEYDVAITPAAGTAIRRVKRRIFQLAEQSPEWTQQGLKGKVAHDHSAKLIAAKKLPQPLTIKVEFFDDDEPRPAPGQVRKEYTLTISFIQDINSQNLTKYIEGNPQYRGYDIMPVLSALNIILAAHPNRAGDEGGVMVGRNRFFFPSRDAPPVALGGGLEAWRGFYSSVRPAHNQLMVNVNVCTTAFYVPGNLADAMNTFRNASFGARVNGFVRGVRVITTHLRYKKSIKSISPKTPRQHTFRCEEYNETLSVEAYFKKKYGITLRFPDGHLVDVGGQKSNLLPAELCEILPNQPFRGKLTDEHTANMITAACKPPNVNGNSIVNQGLELLGYRQGASALGAFGVSIGDQMTVVPGRILPAPGIKYGQGTPRVDERAGWNLRDVKFAVGGMLDNWAVLIIQDGNGRDEFRGTNDPDFLNTISEFSKMCRKSGLNVGQAAPQYAAAGLPPKNHQDPQRDAAVRLVRETILKFKPKPKLILIILSNGDKHVYAGIKHLCDVYLDVPTVCVHSAKIKKCQPQYFANVALKVNMKLGGVNHNLDASNMAWLRKEATMLMGMDVTHPGPGSVKGTPSIAAVVGSIDNNFAQFPASMEIQETKKEMITNLAGLVAERLEAFRVRNKMSLPKRILVYRDGVSEGQFNTVVNEELTEIRAAFRKYDKPGNAYNPKLTIVICGKRHHTRFYPTEAATADRDGNPRPGTVVDRGVTAVYEFDFFLQAHGGLQGTTRPTHYYVVHDEIGFSADELQGLTNSVSYMFARATKAVSLVSPAYYADLCCERGRCYLHKLLQGYGGTATTSTSGEAEIMAEARKLWNGGVHGQLKETMYYI